MRDIVSFVIPLFNGKEYIKRTVSMLQQIKNEKEIVIIDDGSTDGSEEYCNTIKDEYSNVRIYRTENRGIYSARNEGLERAQGKYIVFVDQDDHIDVNNMDYCIDLIRSSNSDAVIWSCMYDDNGNLSYCDEVLNQSSVNKSEIERDLIPSLLFREPSKYTTFIGHIWAGIYSMELIHDNQIKFMRMVDYEDDQLFVYNFFLHSTCIEFVNKPVYYWVTNPASYSHRRKRMDDVKDRYEHYFSYIKEQYRKHVLPCNERVLDELNTFGHQFTFCETIRIFGISPQKEDYMRIHQMERQPDYRTAIKSTPVHIHDRRFRGYLLFSRIGLTRVSIFLTGLYFKNQKKTLG